MGDQSIPVTGYPVPVHPHPTNPNPNTNGYSFSTTTGTAYPYAAPAPQPAYYYNQNPYYHDQDAVRRATFIRWIFALLIGAIILTGTIAFIIWLVLRPRLPDFRVDSLALSNLNISSSSSLLSGNWDARFTVYNPNKKIILSYDHVQAGIFYKSGSLTQTTVPPFFQDTRNQSTVTASFAASSAYVDKNVVEGIIQERTSGGNVTFNVRMEALVRLKAGAWRTRKRFLRVYCGDLTVGISSNSASGSLAGGSKQCRVGL